VAAAPSAKPTGHAAPKPTAVAAAPTAAPLNIGDLVGGAPPLQMPTGPGLSGGGGPTAGGGLSESQIESTVNRYKLGVRRTCWERGSSGVNNAQINVNVKINGTGHVTSAIATGNDPVTGKCLENEIQRWQFPGGPGEVNIPFKFVRQ
jgi:hypothetical protein